MNKKSINRQNVNSATWTGMSVPFQLNYVFYKEVLQTQPF